MIYDDARGVRDPLLEKRQALARALLHGGRPASGQFAPISCRTERGTAPLSFAQERLWFLDRWNPESSFYNVPITLRLLGALHLPALRGGLNALVERHEILRTSFPCVEGRPLQRIHLEAEIALAVDDLSHLSEAERASETRRRILEEASLPFDLEAGPLIRASLLRLGPEEHVLLFILHHIVTDGWSRGVLARDLAALYTARSQDKPSPLAPLPIQYADYAIWQRSRLEDEALQSQLAYWLPQLMGAPSLLELPTDRPRPAVQSFRGARQKVVFTSELGGRLSDLSRRCNATPFMTLMSAFQVLLYRYSGQDDIVLGTPIANRTRSEVEGLIGFFANTLALRGDLSGDPSFTELVGRVRETALGAFAHQDLPFEKLVEELQPERSLSHSPLFQVMFMLHNPDTISLELPGLTIEQIDVDRSVSKLDLLVAVMLSPDSVDVTLEYNTDLFDGDRMRRLLDHFHTLLEAIVADPEQCISSLPMLTGHERHQLLVEWNNTAVEYPRGQCIHQLFEEQVQRTPDATAVEFEGAALTYAELDHRANRLAQCLRENGIGPDVPVGLCARRSLEMMVGLLGILKAGGAYVPIDPEHPPQRVSFILGDAKVALVLTQGQVDEALRGLRTPLLRLDVEPGPSTHTEPLGAVPSACAAYVLYTSGSTGRPKGVVMTHDALVNLLRWQRQQMPGAWRTLQFTSIGFDVSFQEIFTTWCAGGTLVLVGEEIRRDPPSLLRRLDEARIERLFVPFAVLQHLALAHSDGVAEPRALRQVITAGEQLQITDEIASLFGEPAGTSLFNHYGPTEAHVVTAFTLLGPPAAWPTLPPIGQPIANTQIHVLDRRLQPVPVGVPGELYIGGAGLARGYLNRPEWTAEKFVPDPFSATPGSRLYRTGDLARYRPDGSLEYVGRSDYQIKIRGFRVELGEIETVLAQHLEVKEAVVLVREDTPGEKRLIAYVVGKTAALGVGELRQHLKSALPGYMVPAAIVLLEALPLTSNGKVDRKALPAPDTDAQIKAGDYCAPRTPIEEGLAEIWSEVLRLERVGIHDNFFDIGGHSLLATQVISRIRTTLQVELPLRSLFETPTVAGLAEQIAAVRGEYNSAPPLARVSREELQPLSFAQLRLWFIHQMDDKSAVYNIPIILAMRGILDEAALKQSLDALVRRHEALRTTFTLKDGVPSQVIGEPDALELDLVDLRALAPQERQEEARRLTQIEARRAFDLEHGPLLRASLLRLEQEEHLLQLTMHHIVSDAWSQGVLMRELAALYNAFHAGRASPLPELPIQYADYAAWQRKWLQGEVLERQISYWKEHLAGAPALLELPADRPRPPVQTYRGARARLMLSPELTQGIKAVGRREGTTLFMTLLAGFQALLCRYSGQEDIVVGTPIANRTRAEVEGLIGFFVNTLALRGDLSGNPTFKELLSRVRETALEGYAHQDLPFGKLVEELQPVRSLSHSPIFQVLFGLQNAPDSVFALDGLGVEGVGGEGVTAKFDLHFIVSVRDRGLMCSLEYNTDLFDGERIERMLGHFQTMLEGIVADPEQRLSRLPLLSQTERLQLEQWNATARDYPLEGGIHELIEAQVDRTPDAQAVVYEGVSLTYAQLNRRANRLAHLLRHNAVGPDTLVGLFMERSAEMVVAMLAILKAGGAYVPLDPSYPEERLRAMVTDAQTPLILTQAHLLGRMPQNPALCLTLDAAEAAAANEPEQNPNSGVTGSHLAYMIYTSGSTGQPKGAMNTHRGIRNRLLWMQEEYALTPEDRILQKTPFSFDVSVWEFLWPLFTGACLVMARPEGHKDPAYLVRTVVSERITTMHFVPSMLRVFLEESGLEGCSCLKRVICSGEALPVDLQERFFERMTAQLHNLYGPTEAAVDVTYWACRPGLALSSVPIGRPIANTQIYLLDRHMQLAPVGVPGELYIGGVNVARGYHNRPELTRERFLPDPFRREPGAQLYRTGDVARYLSDGNIEFLGRIDHQVKVRGFRIELGEIESVLGQHPSVQDSLVLAREDTPGDKRLVGYVVGTSGDVDTWDLREHLKTRLPDYMVPSAFVVLEAFPLSPNGKVDRKALPAPDGTRPEIESAYTPPSTSTQKILAEIWAAVLRLERVGIHDNFFELGGDSILIIQAIARANQAGLALTPKQVFEHQTIAGLAAVEGSSAVIRSEQGIVTGPVALTPIQHWFFEQDSIEPHYFNQARLLALDRSIHRESVESVTRAILAHHDALRLRFVRSETGWQQTSAAEETAAFSYVDLSALPNEEQGPALTAACVQLQSSLDLAHGPLLRVCYIDFGPENSARLLVTIHHLAVDGVSWRVLLDDLRSGLERIARGMSPVFPPKTTSFQHWSGCLMEHAKSMELRAELNFWLMDARAYIGPLPVDFPEGSNTASSEHIVRVSLDATETRALLQEVPAIYHTQIDDVLLSALLQTFTEWTGERAVLVNLEGHGREAIFDSVDLSRTVGWFTSIYPVLLNLPHPSDPGAALKSVKEQLRRVPNHGVGYGLLRYLAGDAEITDKLAALPPAEVSFNYLGQFDQTPSDDAIFARAAESPGPTRSSRGARSHLLDIIGSVVDGQLHISWLYSEQVYRCSTIQRLAASYLEAVRSLIAHCKSPEAGGYTPSDFPNAKLNQKALDRLFAGINKQSSPGRANAGQAGEQPQ